MKAQGETPYKLQELLIPVTGDTTGGNENPPAVTCTKTWLQAAHQEDKGPPPVLGSPWGAMLQQLSGNTQPGNRTDMCSPRPD